MKDDSSAQVDAAGGKITLSAAREELILNFPAVKVELKFKIRITYGSVSAGRGK